MSPKYKRKPAQQPGRIVRKKKAKKKEWYSFAIMLILFISVLAGILIVILSGPA